MCVIPTLCQMLKAARPNRVSVIPSFAQPTLIGHFSCLQRELEELGTLAVMQLNVFYEEFLHAPFSDVDVGLKKIHFSQNYITFMKLSVIA